MLERFDRRTKETADKAMDRVDFDFGRGVPTETVERIRDAPSTLVEDENGEDWRRGVVSSAPSTTRPRQAMRYVSRVQNSPRRSRSMRCEETSDSPTMRRPR